MSKSAGTKDEKARAVWRSVARGRREAEEFFGDEYHWPTHKIELEAMMAALKSGKPIGGAMRAEIGKALWMLYVEMRAAYFIPTKGRRQTAARLAGIAARLIDDYAATVKDAIFAAIPGDDGERLYESVATTYRRIRRGKIKAPQIGEAALKAAAKRLPDRKSRKN